MIRVSQKISSMSKAPHRVKARPRRFTLWSSASRHVSRVQRFDYPCSRLGPIARWVYLMIPMPHFLVTNDDGYRSDGVLALAEALMPLGEVTLVAPMDEASAIGHALTLKRPLRLEHIRDNVYAVDGTPTDCVNLAVTHVLKRLPDMVVSGINKGY